MPEAEKLVDRIVGAATGSVTLSSDAACRLMRSVEDTMAVAHAGWDEPVARKARSAYPGEGALKILDNGGRPPDAAALVLGTAAHALDYDDVHLKSVTHPSAVILPALCALANSEAARPQSFLPAYAVGLSVTAALGEAMDFSHYEAGWHASSTIGVLAAAAAGCHLLGAAAPQTRNALSLAAAQAGGMQLNFGSDAKPLQAGLAAAAAVRSVRLALAGLEGASDPFAPRGFLDLYAPNRAENAVPDLAPGQDRVSVKLFPCCYAAHRMVAAALQLHGEIGSPPRDAEILLEVPEGLMTPLNVESPATGAQGKFCGAYTVAVALQQGSLGLSDFEDRAVHRPEIRSLMERISIRETPGSARRDEGIGHGTVSLSVSRRGEPLARSDVRHYPGSPQREASDAELLAKFEDCLAIYRRKHNDGPDLTGFRDLVRERCDMKISETA